MSEYFDLSFIIEKKDSTVKTLISFLNDRYTIVEGENYEAHVMKIPYNRGIVLNVYNKDDIDYDTVTISFPNVSFHRDKFDDELKPFTSFVSALLRKFECIPYVLCSFEINGYLLAPIKSLAQFDDTLLSKFPIVYRSQIRPSDVSIINLIAQDIFAE